MLAFVWWSISKAVQMWGLFILCISLCRTNCCQLTTRLAFARWSTAQAKLPNVWPTPTAGQLWHAVKPVRTYPETGQSEGSVFVAKNSSIHCLTEEKCKQRKYPIFLIKSFYLFILMKGKPCAVTFAR